MTEIDKEFDADAFFPIFDKSRYKLIRYTPFVIKIFVQHHFTFERNFRATLQMRNPVDGATICLVCYVMLYLQLCLVSQVRDRAVLSFQRL